MSRLLIFILIMLVCKVSFAVGIEINPMVLYQGEMTKNSYLGLIDNGISKFEKVTKIPVERVFLNERSNKNYAEELNKAALAGYNPIIVSDSNSLKAFSSIAKSFPATKFISLDTSYPIPNVLGLTFNHAEGAYVIGFISGLATTTNQVGFIGGLEIPVIKDFQCGYELGVKKSNPSAVVQVDYINNGIFSWDDLVSAERLADKQYSSGVDIIFPASGNSSFAVLDEAKGRGLKAFGVDSDLSSTYPKTALASMEKKVDLAVFAALMQIKNGVWNTNQKHFGIKQGVIDIKLNKSAQGLSSKDTQLVNELMLELKGSNNPISHDLSLRCEM